MKSYSTLLAVILLLCLGFIYNEMGAEPVQVSQGGYNYHPSMSPDGEFVVYQHMVEDFLDGTALGPIWVFNLKTGQRESVCKELKMSEMWDGHVSWSHDSKYFVFGSGDGLYRYDVYDQSLDSLLGDRNGIYYHRPELSPSDSLIAVDGYCDTSRQQTCIWLFDATDSSLKALPGVDFGPETEIYYYGPQWTTDGKYVVGVFGPDDQKGSDTEIRSINIYSQQSTRVAEAPCTYFVVLDTLIYYARWGSMDQGPEEPRDGTYGLYENSISGSQERVLLKAFDGLFDVVLRDGGPQVYFSRDDSLYTWFHDVTTPLGIRGKNPKVSGGVMLYETYDEKEGVEYDVEDESTYPDNIIWMVKLE